MSPSERSPAGQRPTGQPTGPENADAENTGTENTRPGNTGAAELDPGTDASFDYGGGGTFDDLGYLEDPLTDPVTDEVSASRAEDPEADEDPPPEAGDDQPEPVEDETILMDGRALRAALRADQPPSGPTPDTDRPEPGSEAPAPEPGVVRPGGSGSPPPVTPAPPAAGTAARQVSPRSGVLPAAADAPVTAAPEAPPGTPPGALDEAPELDTPPPAGISGLISALRSRRARGTQLVIALLCGLLGFFAVVQLRLQADDGTFTTARQSDLIRILDDLNDRSDRLQSELRDLEDRRNELRFGSDRSEAALVEARDRRDVLGILAGTVPARGPGIVLRITDPERKVDAAVLLDALQELRDAGAEAVQVNDVRIVAGTDFLDAEPGAVRIDGQVVKSPYVFRVIGDPDTLGPALRIPGGVFAVLDERGAVPTVDARTEIDVDAVRTLEDPENAQATEPED